MSDEVKETMSDENKTMMYVHHVEWDVILEILKAANNVNKVFTFNMPNKATSYVNDGYSLLEVINSYSENEDDKWRIGMEANVSLMVGDEFVQIGEWKIEKSDLNICIPTINSIIIIPNENSTYRGGKEPTKILQLTNCISVKPMLVRLSDVPVEGEEGKYNLGMSMELIIPNEKESESEKEKTTE